MRVLTLELRNVRHLENKLFEFVPGFNLLVGENGRGKTTVIRSLLTALGGDKSLRRRDRFGDDDIRHRAKEFSIEVKYLEADVPASAGAVRPWMHNTRRTGNLPTAPVIWFGANESTASTLQGRPFKRYVSGDGRNRAPDMIRIQEEYLYSEEFPDSPEEDESDFGRSFHVRRFVGRILSTFSPKFERFTWRFVPYGCQIRFPAKVKIEQRKLSAFRREVQSEVLRLFDEEFYRKRRYRGWGSRRVIRFSGDGNPVDNKYNIRPFHELREIMERAGTRFELGFMPKEAIVEVRLAPRIVVSGQDGPLLLGQLSDGEKRLFSMIVDIARQLSLTQGWREISQAPAIVLIDEIDCHLHPRWQRMVVSALEDLFPRCQFIATTHSPFIIQAVSADQLHSVGPEEAFSDFTDKSLEEIAFKVMHIREPNVSRRYLEMLDAAKEFYVAAHQSRNSGEGDQESLRLRLRKLSGRYARNPAFQAFLELKAEGLFGAGA